uniref:Uncharacterized protein n=1 Tax=Siphoviridae sp. ct0106 TaxID=2825290 RepID=A0A8S5P683_9CAUD|nr:MAG TPA: hypothetical protein [Siphoviridae sp. ct0106]
MRGQPHFPNLHAIRAPKTRSGRSLGVGGVIPWGYWERFLCCWLFRCRDFWCLCWSRTFCCVGVRVVCVLCWLCVSCVRVRVLGCVCVRVFDGAGHAGVCVLWG